MAARASAEIGKKRPKTLFLSDLDGGGYSSLDERTDRPTALE